jgi:TP901 family phage tail tape measure protein
MASKVAIEVEIKNIKKVADLKKEIQGLRKEQKEAEKQAKTGQFTSKKSEKQYISTAKAIKNKSKNLRDLNKNLSGSTKATKAATKSSNGMAKQFIKGAAAIGVIVGAFRMVSRVISSVVTTFTEFEFVMSKVNAVSGATEKEFKALDKTAQELGRTTFFTATQVGELMLNFSKLGFSAQEIQNAVKPTLDLATATGSDLARAATVAGSAIRGFGLDADQTARVTDVMAVSFSNSAMDIEKWQTSMTKVAPIAKSAGFSVEDTAALMSKLADSGIEASIAGTSLRNILLKMQDPASDLSQAFGGTVHSLDEMIPAFQKFREEGGNMAEILRVVDLRQAAAFEQMLSNVDKIELLRNKMQESNGESARMAAVIGDTLQGAFLKFTSAVQGLSIAVMEDFATGFKDAIEKVSKFIVVLSENSETITKVISGIARLAKGFAAGFLALKTLTAGMWLYKAGVAAVALATGKATFATKRFIVSLKGVKSAMVKTGLGILVIGLGEVASRFLFAGDKAEDFNETVEVTLDQAAKLKKIEEDLNRIMVKRLADTKKGAEINIGLIKAEIEAREGQIANSILYLGEYAESISTLSAVEEKAIMKAIERLEFRQKLEEDNLKAINQRIADEKAMENDLLTIQNNKLKNAQKIAATTEEQQIAKKQLITTIQKEIDRLNALGVAEKEVKKEKVENTDADWERVEVMKTVLSGVRDLESAERILRDMALSRAEAELTALPVVVMNGKVRLELEQKIIDLKLKNRKETEKGVKADEKALEKGVKAYSDLGSALQEVAGENDKLNGIRKAGEAITKAAAIAESILNLQKAISLVTEGKLTIAKLLGVKATIAGTAATIADTVAEVVSIIPKAISAVLSAFSGPFGIFKAIAAFALIKKVVSWKGEDGGVVPDGDKFADGGMVHGASHANGGVKFAVGGRVNELEGGEAVINKRSTAMFRNQLSSMNEAGGGVKFADGGLMSSPQFTEAQFGANNQSAMMGAMGGQRKVVVVEADITDSQSTVSVIQANATF